MRTGGEYLEQDCTKLKWTTLNPAQVVCDDVLRNKSMKPSHLKLHLTTDKPKISHHNGGTSGDKCFLRWYAVDATFFSSCSHPK